MTGAARALAQAAAAAAAAAEPGIHVRNDHSDETNSDDHCGADAVLIVFP